MKLKITTLLTRSKVTDSYRCVAKTVVIISRRVTSVWNIRHRVRIRRIITVCDVIEVPILRNGTIRCTFVPILIGRSSRCLREWII